MPGGPCDCECARCDQGYHCNKPEKGCNWNDVRTRIARLFQRAFSLLG